MNVSKPPHILFLLPDFFAGGAQRVMIAYANGLSGEFRKTLLSVNDDGPLKKPVSPDVVCETLNTKRILFSLPRLLIYVWRNRPDVIVCTMAYVNFLVLLLKPLLPHTLIIVREANMPQVVLKNAGRLAPIYRVLYKILYPLADNVIVPARYIGEQLHDFIGLNPDNQVILYNPVDTKFIQASLARRHEAEPDYMMKFVAAGRLHWQKGFDRLIKALSAYQGARPWRLDILGDGADREKLQALIEQNGLSDFIFLKGFQENPWVLYAQADYFLLPSYGEGLPNAVLESLECGTPVIAMKEAGGIGEIEEMCDPGSVLVCPSIEGFVRAMEGGHKKQSDYERASLLPDIFKTDHALAQLESVLHRILNNKIRAP